MADTNPQNHKPQDLPPADKMQDPHSPSQETRRAQDPSLNAITEQKPYDKINNVTPISNNRSGQVDSQNQEGRPVERQKQPGRVGARGTAAMDPQTRQEVARKGGLAVSRNKEHMADIGRKGGQSVSKNREHMAVIGRKGGAASRGNR